MWPSFEQLCLCRSYPNHATTVLYDTSTISPYRHLSTVLYSSIVLYSSTQFNSSTVLYSSPALQQQQPLPLLRPNYPPIVILLISQSVKKEPVTTASAASPSTLTAHYAVKSTNTTPTASPTYFPFVYVHPTPVPVTTTSISSSTSDYNFYQLQYQWLQPLPAPVPLTTTSTSSSTDIYWPFVSYHRRQKRKSPWVKTSYPVISNPYRE